MDRPHFNKKPSTPSPLKIISATSTRSLTPLAISPTSCDPVPQEQLQFQRRKSTGRLEFSTAHRVYRDAAIPRPGQAKERLASRLCPLGDAGARGPRPGNARDIMYKPDAAAAARTCAAVHQYRYASVYAGGPFPLIPPPRYCMTTRSAALSLLQPTTTQP